MTSYVFHAELVEEEDGRWSAGVPALPGCATWGHDRSEALRNLQDRSRGFTAILAPTARSGLQGSNLVVFLEVLSDPGASVRLLK